MVGHARSCRNQAGLFQSLSCSVPRRGGSAELRADWSIRIIARHAAVRVEPPLEGEEPEDDREEPQGGLDDPNRSQRRKKGDADWWKNGKPPPF